MKIVFTKHALGKFKSLVILGWKFKRKDILDAIHFPDHISEDKDRGVKIILKKIDEKHNLRVVYAENYAIIVIVTFHPTRRGRYENS